jgi:hypothetical protein
LHGRAHAAEVGRALLLLLEQQLNSWHAVRHVASGSGVPQQLQLSLQHMAAAEPRPLAPGSPTHGCWQQLCTQAAECLRLGLAHNVCAAAGAVHQACLLHMRNRECHVCAVPDAGSSSSCCTPHTCPTTPRSSLVRWCCRCQPGRQLLSRHVRAGGRHTDRRRP